MTDFAGYRALFLECGVDPSAAGRMSLGELASTMDAMKKRRGAVDAPTESERKGAMDSFLEAISGDPSVRIH